MKELRYERRLALMALMAALPAVIVAAVLLWIGPYESKTKWTVMLVIALFWLGFVLALNERVVRPLQTFSNLISALREGDYSFRARGARRDDALGEVAREVNALGEMLREQRLGALEATALLRKVMEEIDVAIFAVDSKAHLLWLNRAAEKLLGLPAARMLGADAAELGLAECFAGPAARTVELAFPGGSGRWGLRRSTFREGGLPHQLLVLSDLSRPLREEERQAWQRLIRVLGHELNNSLAPIKSVAESLEKILRRPARAADWEEDMRHGLGVIGSRAEALSRFMNAYSNLARLPPPQFRSVEVGPWVRRVVGLETRLPVGLRPGPEVVIRADGDQLEQLLINIVRNAVDAALETGGGVSVTWSRNGAFLMVSVEDEGPGLPNTANLFVPFFTTKPSGSGIGLVLSRQIAEAHGGALVLQNRAEARGCKALLKLPLREPHELA